MYLRSADFVAPNETLDPNAYIDPHDLAELKRLAGIPIDTVREDVSHMMGLNNSTQQNPMAPAGDNPWGIKSPVGTVGANFDKKEIEKEKNLVPGTDEWFRLWFTKDKHLTADDFENQDPEEEQKNTLFSKPTNSKVLEAAKLDIARLKNLAGMTKYEPK